MGDSRCTECGAKLNTGGSCVNGCHERSVEMGEAFVRRLHIRDLLTTMQETLDALRDELE